VGAGGGGWTLSTVVDPDLQIRGRGPGHPDPEIGGAVLKKYFLFFYFSDLSLV